MRFGSFPFGHLDLFRVSNFVLRISPLRCHPLPLLTHPAPIPVAYCCFSSPADGPARYNRGAMKSLRFVPLTFVAGVHGFPMFVSYVAVVLAILTVARRVRG